jgi:hypothetical protein
LLLLRRSAAIALATISTAYGVWLSVGSLLQVPFPEELINLAFSAVLFMPLIVLVLGWKSFKGW